MRGKVILKPRQRPSEQRRSVLAKALGWGRVAVVFEEEERGAGAQAGPQNVLEERSEVRAQTRQWGKAYGMG